MITTTIWKTDNCDCIIEEYFDKEVLVGGKAIRQCENHKELTPEEAFKTVNEEAVCASLDYTDAVKVLPELTEEKHQSNRDSLTVRGKFPRKPMEAVDAELHSRSS